MESSSVTAPGGAGGWSTCGMGMAGTNEIHYRALVLSTVALGATVSIVASHRRSIAKSDGGRDTEAYPPAPGLTKDLVYTYLMETNEPIRSPTPSPCQNPRSRAS